MSEMVYRVAKAIGEANLVHLAAWGFSISAPAMNELARAAIAALRDPTAEMVDAGLCGEGDVNYLGIGEDDLAAAYTRMIDAAGKKE